MDFRTPHTVGERINDKFQQLIHGAGYDHCYVLNKIEAGSLDWQLPAKSLTADVLWKYTPQKQAYNYIQVTGWRFRRNKRSNLPSTKCNLFRSAMLPDTPNKAHFPSATLLPGDEYQQVTIYKFGVEK